MGTNYKISIPEPCHENWNKMKPDETGRFCSSCVKSVIDFTQMKTPEIQQYFIQNQGKKICGRFNNEQLDSVIIQIPREVLFSQVQFHKMFMLALLISMGTSLFSCQNSNGYKQKIDKVEVVESVEYQTTGAPISKRNTDEKYGDTLTVPGKIKPPTTTTGDVEVVPVTTGVVAVNVPEPTRSAPAENEILHLAAVDVKPDFPGGLPKFFEYVKSNVKIAEENKNVGGTLFFSFVVNTDGSLSDIKLMRGIDKAIDREVLAVIESSPKWIPGEYNGQKVRVSYSIPIRIKPQE